MNRKSLSLSLAIAVSLLVLASVAQAEGPKTSAVVGYQAQVEKDAPTASIVDAFVSRRAWGRFGASAYVLTMDGWGEGYAGPTYAPADWLEFWGAAGGEQSDGKLAPRFAASVWLGGGEALPLEALVFLEANKSLDPATNGLWYDASAYWAPADWLKIGGHGRHHFGLGPSLQLKLPIPELPIVLWGSWTPFDPSGYAHESAARGILGVKALF